MVIVVAERLAEKLEKILHNLESAFIKQQEKKNRENKVEVKEIRFGPNTDEHDFNFKKNHIEKFIKNGDKVKSYVFFKGREIQHKDKGEIMPSSVNTFRNFKYANLNRTRVALFFREPFSAIEADGIPLSSELSDKLSLPLDKFYNAMEKEFYGLNLNIIKENIY